MLLPKHTYTGLRAPGRAQCMQVFAYRDKTESGRSRSATSSSAPAPSQASSNSSRRDFIEARQVSLFELFDGENFKFDIPEYQRPYSWRVKQVYELLRDLRAAYEAGQEYFLGAVVATRPDGTAGATAPYQVIDGQQRLTSLVMVLSYLRHWCQQQGEGEALAARLQRMLFLEQDPLEKLSTSRYRLQLREADQRFFEDNVMSAYLPQEFHLSTQLDVPGPGAPSEAAPSGLKHGQNSGGHRAAPLDLVPPRPAATAAAGGGGGAAVGPQPTGGSHPLNNETWWRIYQAASFVGKQLKGAEEEGVSLPDWVNHMLKCCYVVVMTARDESASFRIFSTLNGRGMDLSVVDKLKADWLQVLGPEQRRSYAERWSELESTLGRRSFHRLLDHLRTVQAAGKELDQATYTPLAAASSSSSSNGLTLLEHFSGASRSAAAAVQVLNLLLVYGDILLQLRMNDWRKLAAEGGTAPAIAAQLEEACFFINLLADDTWQPWTLQWWHAVDDDQKRLDWLRGAERLQLYCELRGDPDFKQARWLEVGRELLQQPFYSDRVLATLALTDAEQEDMLTRLGCRDLAAEVEDATLIHLLLRADSINRRTISWRRLRVERIVPLHVADKKSLWRKQKLLLPIGAGGSGEQWPVDSDVSGAGSEARRSASPVLAAAKMRGSSAASGSSLDEGGSSRRGSNSRRSLSGSPGSSDVVGQEGAGSTASSSSASIVPPGMREVRYWFEVQRSHWRNRLGNLVLLQSTAQASQAAAGSHLTADIDVKVQYYAACGAEEHFPDFSGGLVTGHYTRDKFSPEECRLRHGDLLARLAQRFDLCQW